MLADTSARDGKLFDHVAIGTFYFDTTRAQASNADTK